MDVLYPSIVAAFFLVTAGLVALAVKLKGEGTR